MFKQTTLFALVLLVGAVVCQEVDQGQVADKSSAPAHAKLANGLKNGFLDLALIGAKGAKRVAQDSRPTIDNIKKTVGGEAKSLGKRLQENKKLAGAWNQVVNNKHVEHAKNQLGPAAKSVEAHYAKLNEKSKPLIDRAAAKAKPLIEQAKQKGQAVLAEHEARQAQLKGQKAPAGSKTEEEQ